MTEAFLPSTCTTRTWRAIKTERSVDLGTASAQVEPCQGVHAIDGDGRFIYSCRAALDETLEPKVRRLHGQAVQSAPTKARRPSRRRLS